MSAYVVKKSSLEHPDKYFRFWMTLSSVRYAISLAREAELKPHEISPEQSAVLNVVRSLENQATPAEIARWLFRKPNTVSAILNLMEKKGLIKKRKDLYVKNLIRVSLTEKGEGTFQVAQTQQSIKKILSVLSNEELDCLQGSFDKLMEKAREVLNIEEIRSGMPSKEHYDLK